MNGPIDAILRRKQLEQFAGILAEKRRRAAKVEHQTRGYRDEDGVWRCGLLSFVRYFWHILEPGTPFVSGWVLEAIAEHLEAVTFGEIQNLLINVFPGAMKSLLTDVYWPAWEWAAQNMPHLRYVAFSYSASITERDNGKFRDLITHPEFQALYKNEVVVRKIGETKISNTKHGWKLASSVGGVGTGERGDRIILDDPHNVKESESDTVRNETVRWFRESMATRLNDIQKGAKVIIMQRVHEDDVSGVILTNEMPYVHLCIPMHYRWDADEDGEPYATEIGWVDPRWTDDPDECEGTLAWPERFPEHSVDDLEATLGPYAAAGQLEQTPEARGGGILKREFWQPHTGKFPAFSYVFASLDGAFTEDETNDPSALSVWGVFENAEGHNRAMLIFAWRKFLQFEGIRLRPEAGENQRDFMARQMKEWGLIEWTAHTCKYWKVDRLLIEAKASGISAAQSLQKRYQTKNWAVQLTGVKGDKVSRAIAVQPTLSNKMVYAPLEKDWCRTVIDECAVFPNGKHDDLCFAAGTMIATRRGQIPIERVRVGDMALTPIGWRKVSAAGLTGLRPTISKFGLCATSNHPIFTFDIGFAAIDTVTQAAGLSRINLCDLMKTARLMKSSSMASHIAGWAESADTISARRPPTQDARIQRDCTSRSGSFTMVARFLRDMKSIIETAILSISSLTIWSAYRRVCIAQCLKLMGASIERKSSAAFDRWHQCGIGLRRGASGIAETVSPVTSRGASIASIPWLAMENAAFVMPSMMCGIGDASSALPHAKASTLTSKRKPDALRPVYNLTVDGAHCYYANGILVHNCDTVTQGLKHLRDLGLLEFDEDIRAEELRAARLPEKDNKLKNYLPGTT